MKANSIWSAQTLSWVAIFLPFIGIGSAVLGLILLLFSEDVDWTPEPTADSSTKEGEVTVLEIDAPAHIEAFFFVLPYSIVTGGVIGLAILLTPSGRSKPWIKIRSIIALGLGILACLMFINP